MKHVVTYQTKKDKFWVDEAGNAVPYSTLKSREKVAEKVTHDIYFKAIKVAQALVALKAFIKKKVDEAIEAFHADYEGKRTNFKGNYTFTNFNGSIKVEVSVSNPIKFDDMTIQMAKAQLDDFLREGISARNEAVKEMVMDAFSTSRGKMDVKKILALKRYTDRINDSRYSKAMQMIDQAIRRPATATYYRVWALNDEGKYVTIPLSIVDVQ